MWYSRIPISPSFVMGAHCLACRNLYFQIIKVLVLETRERFHSCVKPTDWHLCVSSSCYTFEGNACPECTQLMDMYWKLTLPPPPWKKYISSKRTCHRGKLGSQPSRAPELEKSGVNGEGDPYLFEWLNCLHVIHGSWVTITYLISDCSAPFTEDWTETTFFLFFLSKQIKLTSAPGNVWPLVFILIPICTWTFTPSIRTTRGHQALHTHELTQPSQHSVASSNMIQSSKSPGSCPSHSPNTKHLP